MTPYTNPYPYKNITLEYVRFVKQFVAYLAYVQFNRIIYQKTHDILNYIARPDDDDPLEMLDKIFRKNREEHRYSTAIWTDIFQEPNIAIPCMYFIELYNYLLIDPEKTHAQRKIDNALFIHNSRVFQAEPFQIPSNNAKLETALSTHQTSEQYKFILNNIIYDVMELMDTAICETVKHSGRDVTQVPLGAEGVRGNSRERSSSEFNIDSQPYYTYMEDLKKQTRKNGISITNAKGNLEITNNILQQYATHTPQKQFEIYSIWLIEQWLA